GLHRIDAQIAVCVTDQIAVEVVAVGFGQPRPREDIGEDLLHAVVSLWAPQRRPKTRIPPPRGAALRRSRERGGSYDAGYALNRSVRIMRATQRASERTGRRETRAS